MTSVASPVASKEENTPGRKGDDAEFVILYHGQGGIFKGRAEFPRVMLEDANADYSYGADANFYGPTGMFCAFRGSAAAVQSLDNTPYPVFFPPALSHTPGNGGETVYINQVQAIVVYLGEVLGYAPSSPSERARADHISLNAQDYISSGRLSFHPVKSTMSYNDQKEEGDKVSAEWIQARGSVFLMFLEKLVGQNPNPTDPVAGGANLTYADFVLYHVIDATVFQFNNEKYGMFWDHCQVPALKAFYANMCARPRIAAYRTSDRYVPFSGNSMM